MLREGSLDDLRAHQGDILGLGRFRDIAKRESSDAVEVCRMFEESGFNLHNADPSSGRTKYFPLHWAAHYGHPDLVAHMLSRRCDTEVASSKLCQTPLFFAARYKKDNLVALLEARAFVNVTDNKRETALFYALRSE